MGEQRDAFFEGQMYLVDVRGWPPDQVHPAQPLTTRLPAPPGARAGVWAIDPHAPRHLPDPAAGTAKLLDVERFRLGHSGNRTLDAPKRSWALELEGDDELAGMERLVLKAMYNDPSQMREALAWRLFGQADVPAPQHTYARLGVNGTYLGLFSVVEHVDRSFIRSRLGPAHASGNLFTVSCGDLGCVTPERRVSLHGEDDSRQYRGRTEDDQTYRIKSFTGSPDGETYDDLAAFVRAVDGVGIPGDDHRFDTEAYADALREIFDVEAFLRWAGVNVLAGSWDNYLATPANYYLYNGGRGTGDAATGSGTRGGTIGGTGGAEGTPDVMTRPYFTFVPWDDDNSFGIDHFGTSWQYTALVDRPGNTEAYRRFNHAGRRSRIPLVTNLLANTEFRRYYLDHVEHLLDTVFDVGAVDAVLGVDGPDGPTGGGLWDRVSTSAYLESDSPFGWPFTGRQFVNDEVYRAGCRQQELWRSGRILGIDHYVRMRQDRAREELRDLRRRDPAGSSGAVFGVRDVPVAPPVPVG